jgi:hypothetical protein
LPRNLLSRQFRPAAVGLGLKCFSWHWLRHATASLLDAAGAPLGTVQTLLGHTSSVVTREHYISCGLLGVTKCGKRASAFAQAHLDVRVAGRHDVGDAISVEIRDRGIPDDLSRLISWSRSKGPVCVSITDVDPVRPPVDHVCYTVSVYIENLILISRRQSHAFAYDSLRVVPGHPEAKTRPSHQHRQSVAAVARISGIPSPFRSATAKGAWNVPNPSYSFA